MEQDGESMEFLKTAGIKTGLAEPWLYVDETSRANFTSINKHKKLQMSLSFQKAKPKISASRRLFLKVFFFLQILNELCRFWLTEV